MWLRFTDTGPQIAADAPVPVARLWNRFTSNLEGDASWDRVLAWLDDALDPDRQALIADLERKLGLPPVGRAHVVLEHRSVLGRPDFSVRARLEDDRRRALALERDGQPWFTDVDGRTWLVDVASWRLLGLVARPMPAETESQFVRWGELRRAAEAARATLSDYLKRQDVGVIDTPRPVFDGDETGITVRLEDDQVSVADTDELFDKWGPGSAGRAVHTLVRPDGTRKRIVATESGRKALQAVARKRTFRGAAAAQLAENPEAFLAPELFDLSEYSDRVIAIGPPRYRAAVVIESDAEGRDWRSGLSERLVLELTNPAAPEAEPVRLDLTEPERRDEAREAVSGALARQEDFAAIQGHQVRVDPELALSLGKVRSAKPITVEPPLERPADLQGKVLHIKENLDELEHGLATQPVSVPASFRPMLPRGLSPDVTLREHQLDGIARMTWWFDPASAPTEGGLLADDMGLGKTLQVLVVLAGMAERGVLRPSLIVAPVALLENWRREAERFVPGSIRKIAFLSDIPRGRERLVEDFDLVLTSYESLVQRDLEMGRIAWKVVVCDEAQKVKNPSTRAAHVVKAMKCANRVAMTGTPVENSLDELWSIADFFQPGMLGSLKEFRARFASRAILGDDALREQAASELERKLDPVMLRRMKADVVKDLPLIHVHVDEVGMSDVQRTLYQVVRQDLAKGDVLGTIQRLLMACAHPGLLHDAAAATFPKLERTFEILDIVRSRGEKALVFARYHALQELLKAALDERYGLDVQVLNGTTPAPRRQLMIDRFGERSGFDVLVLAPRSCGIGLNITAANHVIHYTREWNPAVEAQATDRAHRIGQSREVHVWIPVVTDPSFTTVEATLGRLLKNKEALRRDFIRPSAALNITLEDFLKGESEPLGAVLDPYALISDRQLAAGLARALGGEDAGLHEFPWGCLARAGGRVVVVTSDPAGLVAHDLRVAAGATTLVVRKDPAFHQLSLSRSLKGLAQRIIWQTEIAKKLEELGLVPSGLLSPPAPTPSEVAAPRAPEHPLAPSAVEVDAVLAGFGLGSFSLSDKDRALLAALLHLPSPVRTEVLADLLERPDSRVRMQVRSLPRVLHAERVPIKVWVTDDERGSLVGWSRITS